MVTTGSAEAAVLFALDLQTAFHAHDWGWDGADDLYCEAAQAFVKAPPGLPRASEYSVQAGLVVLSRLLFNSVAPWEGGGGKEGESGSRVDRKGWPPG